MEENQNVNQNPQKKKMGKMKKIVIAVIAVVVVAIATVAVLGFTGVIDFNFTKKSKADAGIEKVSEVFTSAVNDLETELEEAGLVVKVLENENIENVEESEATVKVSLDVNKFEVEELDGDDEKIVNDIISLINDVELDAVVKSDAEGRFNAKLNATVAEEQLSVEATYDGEKVGVRSEELNEKWLSLDVKQILDELNIDEESMKEIEKVTQEMIDFVEKLSLTEEEMEHFKSTYSNIITDYVTSLEIESEKDKVKVGDKEKKCTKTTITLDEDDIKNLLVSLVETVEDDKNGQEIVKNKIKLVCDFIIENEDLFSGMYDAYEDMDDYYYDDYYYDDYYYDDYYYDDYYYDDYYVDSYEDEYSPVEDIKEFADNLDELFDKENFKMIKDSIDQMEMGEIEITIETYSSLTNIYATNIIFDVEGEKLFVEMTYDGDTTYAAVGMKSSGMSMDMVDVVLVNEKNHKSIEVKVADDMEEYMETEMSFKGVCDIAENNLKTVLTLDLGEEGNFEFAQDLNVKTNLESEYTSTTSNNIKVNIPDVADIDATLNVGFGLKTSNVKVDEIKDSVDLTEAMISGEPDEATVKSLEKYIEDAIPNVQKILKGLKSNKMIEEYFGEDLDETIKALDTFSFDKVIGEVQY